MPAASVSPVVRGVVFLRFYGDQEFWGEFATNNVVLEIDGQVSDSDFAAVTEGCSVRILEGNVTATRLDGHHVSIPYAQFLENWLAQRTTRLIILEVPMDAVDSVQQFLTKQNLPHEIV